MKVRPEAIIGALLILSAFGVPSGIAKTGDATCAGSETWIDDETGDGGYAFGAALSTAGEADIDDFIVSEGGGSCADISFELTVSTSDFSLDATLDAIVVTVDLVEPTGVTDDWAVEYTFQEGTGPIPIAEAGSGATLLLNGEVYTGNQTDEVGESGITLTVPKSTFGTQTHWTGAEASVSDGVGDGLGEVVPLYNADEASTSDSLLIDFGIDSDDDGLPDAWERRTFGDTETAGSGTDTDGDGVSDAQEYKDGTDPNNPDTDGDGATDGEEKTAGTDPLDATDAPAEEDDADSDGDGLDDDWEREHFGDLSQNGTQDPDEDGCDNECEETNGTDPNDPDTDGDGATDGEEVTEGTNANDPQSAPAGSSIDFSKFEADSEYAIIAGAGAGGVIILSIVALAGRWKL